MITIIIPALNEAATIVETLRPLQALRGEKVEVLLVDGGSVDGTAPRARGLCDRVLVAQRHGRAHQMNLGADAARGSILWFLHADTLIPASAASQISAAVEKGASWGRFDVRLSGTGWPLRMVARLMNLRSRWTGIATGDQGIFVTAAAFRRVGGFPEQPLMEDVEISRRLRRISRPACLRGPLVTSSRRWESDGVWRTIALMWSLRLAYFLGVDAAALYRRYYRRAAPGEGQS